jgi:hypothetical protein
MGLKRGGACKLARNDVDLEESRDAKGGTWDAAVVEKNN